MTKRKKAEWVEPSGQRCAWAGCDQPGDFRAPRSKTNLREYQWFCEDHIREFNKQWNYFEGMTQDEIYDFQKDATHGHRPTWRMDQLGKQAERKMEEALHRMFGDGTTDFKAAAKPISARVKDALAVLDLAHPSDKPAIKAQYRELVKKYHPDVNKGNARAEDTFKKITASYHYLMAHYVESK
jgi:hypothetical protein